jgi:hypothetical protein
MDDTIERRWGRRISACGIYRDPVRSSHGHFVKASGLRWRSFMVLTPVPWTRLIKALPVLTLLASSERSNCRHKLLTDGVSSRHLVMQLCHWLPGRRIIFVGDSSFAVHELPHVVTRRATLISRRTARETNITHDGTARAKKGQPCQSSRPCCLIPRPTGRR